MPNPDRASIILRCPPDLADKVRQHAAVEHRTVAGYLLYVLDRNNQLEEKYNDECSPLTVGRARDQRSRAGYTTAIHLRCSVEEANRIRRAAARRQMSMSRFIVFAMERSWRVMENARRPIMESLAPTPIQS